MKYCRDSEIIVIDDGSTDNTGNIIKEFSNIKIIRHKENKGYGAALKTGIENATKDIIVTIDADETYSIKDVDSLISNFDDYDMVIGARIKNDSAKFSLHQKIAKSFVCFLLSAIFKKKVLDINSGFNLIKRSVVKKYFPLLPDSFPFPESLTLLLLLDNHKIKYAPINYHKRTGKSKINVFSYILDFIASYQRIIRYYIIKHKR